MKDELFKLLDTMDQEKRALLMESVMEADEANNWPESGSRHSNHRQPLGTRIMHIRNIVDSLPVEAQKAYINTLIAVGVLPKPKPKTETQNGKKKI